MQKSLVSEMKAYAQAGRRICTACGVEKPFAAFSKCSKERLGIRSRCRPCVNADEQSRRDPEKERTRGEIYRQRFPEIARERKKRWRAANLERARARDNAYNADNPDKVRATARRYYERVKALPAYRLKSAIKAGINQRLTKGKGGVSTFKALGYTVDDLRAHIEARFQPGMSWNNYGRGGWEIDHIYPLSAVPCESIEDPAFRTVWALDNLQPLWVSDNRSKGARILAL